MILYQTQGKCWQIAISVTNSYSPYATQHVVSLECEKGWGISE